MRAVNLLPKEESYGKKSAPLPLLVGVGLAVLVTVAICAGFLQASGKVADRQQQLEDRHGQLDALPVPPRSASTASVVSGLSAQQQARVTAVGQALSRRVVWDRLLREISQVLPGDVWLSSLDAKSPLMATSAIASAPVPGAAPSGFTLSGFTYSQDGVARVLARIQVLPDLTNVQLEKSSSTQVGDRNVVSFTILADVRAPGGAS
jgi:Tfp pilus assembly protein PilN